MQSRLRSQKTNSIAQLPRHEMVFWKTIIISQNTSSNDKSGMGSRASKASFKNVDLCSRNHRPSMDTSVSLKCFVHHSLDCEYGVQQVRLRLVCILGFANQWEQPASVVSNIRKSLRMRSLQFRYKALGRYVLSIIVLPKSSIGFFKWLG